MVSHDESFVNSILLNTPNNNSNSNTNTHGNNYTIMNNEIYTISNKNVSYFEGTFKDYKKSVMKSVIV